MTSGEPSCSGGLLSLMMRTSPDYAVVSGRWDQASAGGLIPPR